MRDIKRIILYYLDLPDLYNIRLVCREFAAIYHEDTFWSLKYLHDFKEDISKNRIKQCLELTPRQAYIQRYTQEGGVTYGSESFIFPNKLFPRVVRSNNFKLFKYYIDLNSRKNIFNTTDWVSAAEEALKLKAPAEYIENILEQSKSCQVLELLRGYYYSEVSSYYSFLGALYAGDDEAIINFCIRSNNLSDSCYHKLLLEHGKLKIYRSLIEKDFISTKVALIQYIDAGIPVDRKELEEHLTDDEIIRQLIYGKYFNYELLREKIKNYSHLQLKKIIHDIPPHRELINLFKELGYDHDWIKNNLQVRGCPLDLLREYHDKSPNLSRYIMNIICSLPETKNYYRDLEEMIRYLMTYSIAFNQDLDNILSFLWRSGLKDLWLYILREFISEKNWLVYKEEYHRLLKLTLRC